MSYVKTIVCLANSYKPPRGRCIAGKEVLGNNKYGGWVRPVSARPKEEVSLSECRYHNQAIPKLLDIIDVPLLNAAPHNHQTENHLLDPKSWWVKRREFPWDELEQLRDRPASLWIDYDSTSSGVCDCMSRAEAATVHNSLLLIKEGDFTIDVGSKTWEGVKARTYRGNFKYNATYYSMSITDPAVRNAVEGKAEGQYPLSDVYLCISLTELFEDGRCHKLVAGVIRNPPL